MDRAVVAHAGAYIADAGHGESEGFIVIEMGSHIVGVNAADGKDKSTNEEGTDEEGDEAKKGLHDIGMDYCAIEPHWCDGTGM